MKGIKQQKNGSWRVFVSVDGQRHWKRLPASYTRAAVIAWREKERTRLRYGVDAAPDSEPTFAEHADDYLKLVQSMPSRWDRERQIQKWVSVFGSRIRATITATDITRVMEAWKADGMSGATLNRHRTALMHLWTKLDGKGERNPVKGTDKYPEGDDAPLRVQPYDVWQAILDRLWDGTTTRARFHVMMWTGWPHAVIKRLKLATDVDWKGRVYVRRRKKGKGVKGKWIAVLPQAITALREFQAAKAEGEFSNSAFHSRIMAKVRAMNVERENAKLPALELRPYDVRHSFGTLMALIIKDERALQELLIHASPATVRRYTELATEPRTAGAIAELATALKAGTALASLTKALGNVGNFSSHVASRRVMAKASLRTTKHPRKRAKQRKRARQDSNLRPPA